MAAAATATRRQPGLRFPCGHVAGPRAVARRLRSTPTAAWIARRRCNVIAIVIGAAAATGRGA
jgi:hypothetical protein